MASTRAARNGRLLAVLLVAPFMAQADATIANVATPAIHADLGASGAALQLVIGGYLIAFAVLLISGARLGQTHGYRRIFVVGVSVFTLASLLCALAPSPIVLVWARVIQGAGAALMFPQTLSGIQLRPRLRLPLVLSASVGCAWRDARLGGHSEPGLGDDGRERDQSALSGGPSSDMSCFSKIAATTARSGVPLRVAGPSSS